MKKNNDDFQYDSCVSRGICSINPRTYSLQRVLVLYLILISKYALDLYKEGVVDNIGKELILNTVAIAVSNPEFTESSFVMSIERFKEILPKIVKKYRTLCQEQNIEELDSESLKLIKESSNINQAIRFGEKDMLNFQNVSMRTRDLYRIMLVIAKSLSINLMNLESYKEKFPKAFEMVLKLLSSITHSEQEHLKIKNLIFSAVNTDIKLMKLLRKTQEKVYGKQGEAIVSFSTTPSKAVLVVGSDIKELENVLKALKETDIDVYTHDDMMLAHTFPKFNEYKNLKGQYGHGLENCLLDFATFPGPIILTKHSLRNIENFYRGRLFTTDYTSPKGVIKIENDDYSEVIESAKNSKGFKTGKNCESIEIGYDYEKVKKEILEKINNNNYKKILIIGLESRKTVLTNYFDKLFKYIPDNFFVISFSANVEKKNVYHLKTCFDSYSAMKIYEAVKRTKLPVTAIIPNCDRNAISNMIYLSKQNNTSVYLGECEPIILNPTILTTLENVFDIKQVTSAKKDMEDIINILK